MELLPVLCIVTVAFTGLTKGAGVLPDGPLNATVGETVTFTPTLPPSETPFITVDWRFDGRDIISSNANVSAPEFEGRITLSIYNGSLELRNVAFTDSGQYSVFILPPKQTFKDGSIELKVYERVSNVKANANTTDLVEFISSVRLSCSSSGSPPFSFLWLNGSSEVTESDRIQLTDGSNLTILYVTRYDQGPFRCRVSNPVSDDISNPVNFSISFGPENTKLTISPSKEYYEEGSNITLNCSTVSSPAAQFYWFLNEVKLSETESELKLVNIHRNQSGSYSCQAFNSKTGRNETSQPLFVSVLGKISDAKVTSTNLPIEGNSVNLTCDAAGSVFTITWMKDGSDINPNDNMILYNDGSVLSFSSLKKSDSGEYSCKISNPINFVEVKYTMVVNYGPDNVHITGPNEIRLGQMLELTCSADSTPSAGFTWTLNGTKIHNSDVFTKDNTELSDSGNYTCRAMNNITGRTSPPAVHILSVTDNLDPKCSPGCIAGIVIACLVVLIAAAVAGYFIHKRRKRTKKSSSGNTNRSGGEGRVNTGYSGNQEPQYADIKLKKSKPSGAARMESEDTSTQYAEIRVNNNPPAVSSPPSYDAHMQRYQNVT